MADPALSRVGALDRFATALELHTQRREDFPLRYFRCMSWAQEQWIRSMFIGLLDTYWHSGNAGGKTAGGTFTDLAACCGIDHVVGYYRVCPEHGLLDPRDHPLHCPTCGAPLADNRIALPVIKPPVTWGIGFPSYKLFATSGLPMVRHLLGKWPHVEAHQGNRNTVTQFFIRHRDSKSTDQPDETWSTLFTFPYDGEQPESARLDGWRCDEPPPAEFLDALRMRVRKGRPLRGGITATPLARSTWEPILSQYPDAPLAADAGRIRIQSSVFDNLALTDGEKADIIQRLNRRPKSVQRARLYGDHQDMSGDCPFDLNILEEMEAACTPPMRIDRIPIQRKVEGEHSQDRVVVTVEFHVWDDYQPGDRCFITADVGKGIRDGKHDPDCCHVWSERRRKLLGYVNAPIGGYGLGRLLAMLAPRYGNAMVDPAVTGGYGEAVLDGIHDGNYWLISREQRESAPGKRSSRLGFWESRTANNEWREAVETALALRNVTIPARDVIVCLKNLVVGESGEKIKGGKGSHDEHWVCAGRAIFRLGAGHQYQPLLDSNAIRAPISALQTLIERARVRMERPEERW